MSCWQMAISRRREARVQPGKFTVHGHVAECVLSNEYTVLPPPLRRMRPPFSKLPNMKLHAIEVEVVVHEEGHHLPDRRWRTR